jgi:hypothetical protein
MGIIGRRRHRREGSVRGSTHLQYSDTSLLSHWRLGLCVVNPLRGGLSEGSDRCRWCSQAFAPVDLIASSRRYSCTPERVSAVECRAAMSLRCSDCDWVLRGDVSFLCTATVNSLMSFVDDPERRFALFFLGQKSPGRCRRLSQVTPQHRQRLLNANATFGDCLLSPVEFHQSQVAQSWKQHHVWWLTGEAGAGDVVLHDVDRVGEHIEISRRRLCLRLQLQGNLRSLFAHRRRQMAQHPIEKSVRNMRRRSRRRVGLSLEPSPQQVTVKIDRDDYVRPECTADRDRYGVGEAAIYKPFVVDPCRAENGRQRDRRTHRFMDWPGPQPYFAAGGEIRGDGSIGFGITLDWRSNFEPEQDTMVRFGLSGVSTLRARGVPRCRRRCVPRTAPSPAPA